MNKSVRKKICWVTASYFLDVDLPVVPNLSDEFEIDLYIITNERNEKSDLQYIKSQTNCRFTTLTNNYKFFSPKLYKFYKKILLELKTKGYDWYYFDISDYLFLFPLVDKMLPKQIITIATHNVSVPKGARYPLLARLSMRYIVGHFQNFQVFSKNQKNVLLSKNTYSDVFNCPLMLKDYGNRGEYKHSDTIRFLFFGNIIRYKRLDLLLDAVKILENRGVENFSVTIAGYCKKTDWDRCYASMIKSNKIVCDIRRIPNELVPEYFNNCDYFVMPYQDIAQSGAMTVAFNYNVPIIASDLDTFTEFLHDGIDGYFFEQENSLSLADVMEKAISNTSYDYNKLRMNQQTMIDKSLSSDVIINKYKNYFKAKLDANSSF